GCADPAHSERETEEEPGDHSDFPGHEFLCVDEDRGEGGGEDHTDRDAEHARPGEADVWEREGEGEHAEDRAPDHELPAEAVSDRPADDRARGDGAEKDEEVDLCGLYRDAEPVDQVEGVV